MKSLDYSKVLRSLRVPWGATFDPGKAVNALAHDFVEESSAKSLHIRISMREGTGALVAGAWSDVAGGYQENGGAGGPARLAESILRRAIAGLEGEGEFFCHWYGAKELEGVQVDGGAVLAMSIPFPEWVASACLVCGKAEVQGFWVSQLTTVLTSLVERVSRHVHEDLSAQERRQFYEDLSAVAASHPRSDLKRLCEIWKRHSGADWVWLWLHNDTAQEWELAGCEPASTADYLIETSTRPSPLTTPSLYCVAEYCIRAKKHEFVEDPKTWREKDPLNPGNPEEFRVVLAELLKEKRCVALDCVPLIPPPVDPTVAQTSKSAPLRIRGAVCLYYEDVKRRREQPSEVYMLMGRISASTIVDSYEAEQRDVLFSLNHLTEKYLTQGKARPAERRAGYLKELRDLVSKQLNVEHVSIFWKDAFQNKVGCVETSGLWKGDGSPVPMNAIANVKYDPGQGITGGVFATGKLHRSNIGTATNHKPLFTEIPPLPSGERVEDRVAWIACPIPFFTGDPEAQKQGAVQGVIRCVGNKAHISPGKTRDFDTIQLEELSFITRQVTPVLEAMAANIARERSVSVIKHDLFAPLRMILDTAEELGRDLEKGRKPSEYAISDLGMSAFMARQLAIQLDPNPTDMPHVDLKPTLLEGDIMARLKAMLGHYAKQERDMKIVFGDFRNFPSLKVDQTLIERVLHNLIVNAIKYGSEGSEIRVMPLVRRDSLIVAVSNYGIGIEPGEEKYLFSGNYRSPRAEKCSHGHGLGLKIAKAAMEAHGGRLELTQAKDPTIFSMIFQRKSIAND